MLIEEDDDEDPSSFEEDGLDLGEFGVSLHAMEGCTTPLTLRITGRIGQERVTILIDSGAPIISSILRWR